MKIIVTLASTLTIQLISLRVGLMSRHTESLDTFYLTQLDVLMELVVSSWPDAEYYLKKLRRVREHLMEFGAKAFEANPNHFNTLIHGDMFVLFHSFKILRSFLNDNSNKIRLFFV